jgi:HPt (histidine-containing phosphotransfer) domain-containing protein
MTNGPCAALLERVGGDEAIFAELCDVFLADAPARLEVIRAALVAADTQTLQREAHAFKGSAGAFDALEVVEVARQLEQLAAIGDLRDAHHLWKLLQARSRTLIEAVRAGKERRP